MIRIPLPENNKMRVCSVVSLDDTQPRAPLKRQLSVDEERGCNGHWSYCEVSSDAARGLRLYRAFLIDSLKQAGLRVPSCILKPIDDPGSWWEWLWESRALTKASRRFSKSSQRAALRIRAASVQISALDFETFQHILQVLFQEGGATIERILALFYFVAELSVAALRSNSRTHFCRLTHWVSKHIAECATTWVCRHKGWGAVVRTNKFVLAEETAVVAAITAACALAAICVYKLFVRPTTTKIAITSA